MKFASNWWIFIKYENNSLPVLFRATFSAVFYLNRVEIICEIVLRMDKSMVICRANVFYSSDYGVICRFNVLYILFFLFL